MDDKTVVYPNRLESGSNADIVADMINNNGDCDIEWMYDYAQYVFMKYIDADSEFCVNVSYKTRRGLLLFFSKNIDEAFEHILNAKGVTTPAVLLQDNAKLDEKYANMIQSWMYHMFDNAVTEIWNLMSKDTFLRFMHTAEYQYLVKKYHKQQV